MYATKERSTSRDIVQTRLWHSLDAIIFDLTLMICFLPAIAGLFINLLKLLICGLLRYDETHYQRSQSMNSRILIRIFASTQSLIAENPNVLVTFETNLATHRTEMSETRTLVASANAERDTNSETRLAARVKKGDAALLTRTLQQSRDMSGSLDQRDLRKEVQRFFRDDVLHENRIRSKRKRCAWNNLPQTLPAFVFPMATKPRRKGTHFF